MRGIVAAILICLVVGLAHAEEDPRQAQVDAATLDAGELLRKDVLSTHVGNDLTVEMLVDRCDARGPLNSVIQNAHQIGGARWLDDQMVQVRLELRGSDLADVLDAAILKHPTAVNESRTVLDHLKREVASRIFSSTGTSTAGSAARRLMPDPEQIAWRRVADPARVAAIDAARRNAVDHVLDSLSPIELDKGRHMAEALAIPAVHDRLRDWLAGRPITSIEFRDDLEVRLTLSAAPEEFWSALRAALEQSAPGPSPHAPDAWDKLRAQVFARMAQPIGVALAPAGAVAAAPPEAIAHDVPAWAQQSITTDGVSGRVGGTKLRTARAAEAVATEALRTRLVALPLTPSITLGDAAARDPRVAQAIFRSLARAKISKVEYDSPIHGSVRVQMSLDLNVVWRELTMR